MAVPVAMVCFGLLLLGVAILVVATNQPMETSVNAAGARGDPGKKQKTCPPRCKKPFADQKKQA